MKKYSFSFITSNITLCILSIAFIQCTTPAKDKTLAVKDPVVSITPVVMESKVGMVYDTLLKEPKVVIAPSATKTKVHTTVPSTKATAIKKPAVVTKATMPKPREDVKILPTTDSAIKKPEIDITTSLTKSKEAIPPTPVAAPLIPVAFSFKSLKAVVQGTSTLHKWESQITKIEGKGSFQSKDNKIVTIKDMEVKIEVEGIKSKEGKIMDNKTFETFSSDKNPFIIYAFSNAPVKIDASNAATIEASGNLTMAGINKPVPVMAKGQVLPNGDLQLSISKKLKMSDFNMKPPVMMLGTIKVGDEVTLVFDIVLTPAKAIQ